MSSDLLLGVRLDTHTLQTIKLSDVDLRTKVEELRKETATRVQLPKDSFELVFRGCILEDDATMESCGLRNGVTIHVLNKMEPEKPTPAKSITEGSVLQLATAFRSFNENPALRSALHRLSKRPEVIENIISTSPGLNEDSVSIAMLQDPDLMAHFTDPDTVRRIAELHPVLVEAAQLIAAAVHEEARLSCSVSGPGGGSGSGGNASTTSAPSTAYSYSLDNLSDDEEMAGDSSQSSDSAQPNLHSAFNSSAAAITTAQLAAALSRAGARGFPLSTSSSSTSGSSGVSNSGLITTEMFTQAIQQAFASAPSAPSNPLTSGASTGTPPVAAPPLPLLQPAIPQISDLERQLAQMHEIGLQDDTVNVQALQFTNGDVQAAIELVFSGFSDN
ncbi:ubiquitin-like protein 7 [Venturia canescens]|uniref:ubiquitin-like protein 7 n=1 Tax=Venturia canescens TaxID=32260 RepID=UPI001C9C2B8D|nr:ubiquitin-like protein 7 [Venturia canescens]